MSECSVRGCGRKLLARGFCTGHYARYKRHGSEAAAVPIREARKAQPATARDEAGRKFCGACRTWLSESNFSTNRNATDGLMSHCRQCASHYARLRGFKLSKDAYESMVEAQRRRCAICRRPDNPGFASWHVDHDHSCCPGVGSCGKCVRGLLCAHCSAAIGLFGDRMDVLVAATDYLRNGGQVQ